MTEGEIRLIKEVYDFLLETDSDLLRKNIIEIENNQLELPFEVTLKKKSFFKILLNDIFLGFYGYPFGLLYYKAKKDKEKKLLLKQKKELKKKIDLVLQETEDKNIKHVLIIFLASLCRWFNIK